MYLAWANNCPKTGKTVTVCRCNIEGSWNLSNTTMLLRRGTLIFILFLIPRTTNEKCTVTTYIGSPDVLGNAHWVTRQLAVRLCTNQMLHLIVRIVLSRQYALAWPVSTNQQPDRLASWVVYKLTPHRLWRLAYLTWSKDLPPNFLLSTPSPSF